MAAPLQLLLLVLREGKVTEDVRREERQFHCQRKEVVSQPHSQFLYHLEDIVFTIIFDYLP